MAYRGHSADGVNFYYLCTAIASAGEKIKYGQMAQDWQNECIFPGFVPSVQSAELGIGQALLIIKQCRIVQLFLCDQPLKKIVTALGDAAIDDSKQFLQLFNCKRIIFLEQVVERFTNSKLVGALADELLKQFQDSFLAIDRHIVGLLIKTQKDELEEFLLEVTHFGLLLSGGYSRAAARCIGCVVNYLHLEEPAGLDKHEFFPQLYAKADTFFMDGIEQYFGLITK